MNKFNISQDSGANIEDYNGQRFTNLRRNYTATKQYGISYNTVCNKYAQITELKFQLNNNCRGKTRFFEQNSK